MHCVSIVMPSAVSVVTTADMPVASPALIVMPSVDDLKSSSWVSGTCF